MRRSIKRAPSTGRSEVCVRGAAGTRGAQTAPSWLRSAAHGASVTRAFFFTAEDTRPAQSRTWKLSASSRANPWSSGSGSAHGSLFDRGVGGKISERT